jgi:hypothetical protein
LIRRFGWLVLRGSTPWPSRVVGREAAALEEEEKMEVEKMGVPVELGVLGGILAVGLLVIN